MPRIYWKSLVDLVKEHVRTDLPVNGCEVGIWRGKCSTYLLRCIPNLHLLMVDCYRELNKEAAEITLGPINEAGEVNPITQEEAYQVMLQAFQNTQDNADRRTFIVGDSLTVSKFVTEEFLDFVFIDASHDYESVRFDIQTWYSRVKAGGLVCGHDYDGNQDKDGLFGVKQAVDEFAKLKGYQVKIVPGRIWYFIK